MHDSAPKTLPAPKTTRDLLLKGRLSLHQPAKGHRVGTDAVLLAAQVQGAEQHIADFGAATGAVGLMAALRSPAARVSLIENAPELCALARQNCAENGLIERVNVIEADILALGKRADLRESFDLVLTNPPFFSVRNARLSPNANRAKSHVFLPDQTLDLWLRNAASVLKPKGALVMIHRADAIEEILAACKGRFGAVELTFIHPYVGEDAIRCLIRGIKGSRAGLNVRPALLLHGPDGRFTPYIAALHAGDI